MAYNTPPTQTPGDIVTAAMWNTYIRDNFEAGVPALFTTKGDIVAATGADAAVRVGSNPTAKHQVLTTDNSQASGLIFSSLWGITYPCRAYRSTNQTLVSGTNTQVLYDTEVFDPRGVFSTVTSRFTAPSTSDGPADGYYQVSAQILTASFAWVAGDTLEMHLHLDGTNWLNLARHTMEATQTGVRSLSGSGTIYVGANSYLDIRIYTNRAGVQLLGSGQQNNHFSVHRIG